LDIRLGDLGAFLSAGRFWWSLLLIGSGNFAQRLW